MRVPDGDARVRQRPGRNGGAIRRRRGFQPHRIAGEAVPVLADRDADVGAGGLDRGDPAGRGHDVGAPIGGNRRTERQPCRERGGR